MNTDKLVFAGNDIIARAGAWNGGSNADSDDGRYTPFVSCPWNGGMFVDESSKPMYKFVTSYVPPQAFINKQFVPVGPTKRNDVSPGVPAVNPFKVTPTRETDPGTPLTTIEEGYGFAVVGYALSVIVFVFVNERTVLDEKPGAMIGVKMFDVIIPGTPGGPTGPVKPMGPVAPGGPFDPVEPVYPIGPCGPAGPCIPENSIHVEKLVATGVI